MPPNSDPTVVVIGAGPAGLYCAATLAASRSWRGTIILLEKGPPVSERYLSPGEWIFKPGAVLEGEGGPGFLADAKLCVSSDAGAKFDRPFLDLYPKAIRDIDFEIYATLLEKGHEVRLFQPNRHAIVAARNRLKDFNLSLETYPVRSLGSDLARQYLERFTTDLRERGVEIRCRAEVTDIIYQERDQHPFVLSVSEAKGISSVRATHVVLAVGRSGATWLSRQRLGLLMEPNHLDIGVRIEFPLWGGEQMRELGANPKVKSEHGISYAKTHCFVHAGRVIGYLLDDRCLIDAHASTSTRACASSMNVLYRVTSQHMADPKRVYLGISGVADSVARGKPLRMPLPKFLGKNSLPDDACQFEPTLPDAVEADLGLIFPEMVLGALRTLIARLSRFAPGIATKGSMVYAPAAEWLSPKVRTDGYFRVPALKNAWCVGDGSGRTSGVLPAAASGVVAALDLLRGPSRQQELEWRFP
jgi:uncharacterized FAD-dependent dehydrogenase